MAEHFDQRDLKGHRRIRHPDQHRCAGQVARIEGLPEGLRPADGVDDDVRTEAAGQLT